jgi:hypothetical protein
MLLLPVLSLRVRYTGESSSFMAIHPDSRAFKLSKTSQSYWRATHGKINEYVLPDDLPLQVSLRPAAMSMPSLSVFGIPVEVALSLPSRRLSILRLTLRWIGFRWL